MTQRLLAQWLIPVYYNGVCLESCFRRFCTPKASHCCSLNNLAGVSQIHTKMGKRKKNKNQVRILDRVYGMLHMHCLCRETRSGSSGSIFSPVHSLFLLVLYIYTYSCHNHHADHCSTFKMYAPSVCFPTANVYFKFHATCSCITRTLTSSLTVLVLIVAIAERFALPQSFYGFVVCCFCFHMMYKLQLL